MASQHPVLVCLPQHPDASLTGLASRCWFDRPSIRMLVCLAQHQGSHTYKPPSEMPRNKKQLVPKNNTTEINLLLKEGSNTKQSSNWLLVFLKTLNRSKKITVGYFNANFTR
jgi:hypothetical protein